MLFIYMDMFTGRVQPFVYIFFKNMYILYQLREVRIQFENTQI